MQRTRVGGAAAAVLLLAAGCGGGAGAESGVQPREQAPTGGSSVGSPAAAAGAWPDSGEPLVVMGLTAGDEVATARIDHAEAQRPEMDLQIDENGFDAQKFATAVAGGEIPTGAYMDRALIAQYAQQGLLEPLDGCLAENGIDLAQYYPAAVQDVTWQGQVYGVPNDYQVRTVLLNNRVLEKAGLTADDIDTGQWDQLLTQATSMYEEADGRPSVLGFDPKITDVGYLQLWTMAHGGSILADDGSPTLNDPAVVETLQFVKQLIDAQGGWADFSSFKQTWDFFGQDNQFVTDQVGGFPMEQWYPNVLADFLPDLDLSAVPFRAEDGSPISFETGGALVIPKGSANPGGMCAFAGDFTSVEAWAAAGQARAAANEESGKPFTGLFTANQQATEQLQEQYVQPTDDAGFDAVIQAFYDAVPVAQPIPASPAGQEIQNAYQQAVVDVLGGKDAQQALDEAQDRAASAYEDAMG